MFKIGFLIISFELSPKPVPPEKPCPPQARPPVSEVRKSDYFRNPTSAELDELEKRYGYQKNVWGI